MTQAQAYEDRIKDDYAPLMRYGTYFISVKDTDPGLKGDTATNTFKPAILENGIEIKVPLFISPGDFISVDTRSMEYQGRVNK